MEDRFVVDGNELACHIARPARLHPTAQPGVVHQARPQASSRVPRRPICLHRESSCYCHGNG